MLGLCLISAVSDEVQCCSPKRFGTVLWKEEIPCFSDHSSAISLLLLQIYVLIAIRGLLNSGYSSWAMVEAMPDRFDILFPFGLIQVVEEEQVFDYDPASPPSASLSTLPPSTPPAAFTERRYVSPQRAAQHRLRRARRAALAQSASSDSETETEPRQPRRRPRRRPSSSSSSTAHRDVPHISARKPCVYSSQRGLVLPSESSGISSSALSTSLIHVDDDDRDRDPSHHVPSLPSSPPFDHRLHTPAIPTATVSSGRHLRTMAGNMASPNRILRHSHTAPEVYAVSAASSAPSLRRCHALGGDQFRRACLPTVSLDDGLNRVASVDIGHVRRAVTTHNLPPPSTTSNCRRKAFSPAQARVNAPRQQKGRGDQSLVSAFDACKIHQ